MNGSVYSTRSDTIYADNRNIRFALPQSLDEPANTDIIKAFSAPAAAGSGFVMAGQPFYFSSIKPTPPIYVGIKYTIPPSLLNAGYSYKDVRFYRYDSTSRAWDVVWNASIDSVNGYAVDSFDTKTYSQAFAVMIDTDTPQVTWLNKANDIVTGGITIYDTLRIAGNVGNMQYSFVYREGDKAADASDSETQMLSSTVDTVQAVMSDASVLGSDAGILSTFSASDGHKTVTLNLSPVVRLASAATFSSQPNIWCPIHVAAIVDSPNAHQLLSVLTLQ